MVCTRTVVDNNTLGDVRMKLDASGGDGGNGGTCGNAPTETLEE